MNYYIGDTHFGHANVIRHDQRPFSNIDEMDRAIIENWNNRVTNSDNIYIVGDFIYHGEKEPEWYLKQLKGKKHFIIGNHDAYYFMKKYDKALNAGCMINNYMPVTFNELIENNRIFKECNQLQDGKDIMYSLGLKPGKQVGFILNTLLDEVINDNITNEKDVLLSRAFEILEENNSHR